jgi:hypothetical protein
VYYLTALRVRGTLKWLAIVLGALYALLVAVSAGQGVFSMPVPPVHSGDCPLPALFAVASIIAAVCATILACSLCQANDGHLPVVWTLPASRTVYALTTFAMGAVGVLAAFAMTLLALFISIATFRILPAIGATSDTPLQLIRFLCFPFAMYGFATAITASIGKGGGAIAGWSWIAMVFSGVFAGLDLPQPWHAIFTAINLIDPMRYASYSTDASGGTVQVMTMPGVPVSLELGVDIAALVAIAIAGYIAGIWQWRRVEG